MAEAGDKIDLESLVASKFAVPPLRWIADRAPAFPTQRPRRTVLSPFQKLPREIRHEIYRYLGFPVGGRLWVRCFDAGCSDPTHECSRPAEWWSDTDRSNHDKLRLERYEHSMIADTIIFQTPEGRQDKIKLRHDTNVGPYSLHVDRSDTVILPAPWMKPMYCRHWPAWALLNVCNSIRDEALDLLFGHTKVEFNYELSDKPVHYYSRWEDGNAKTPYLERYHRMRLNPGWFAQIQHTHLTNQICGGKRKGIPWRKTRFNTKCVLQKQAKSLLFVAKYCPALVTLRTDLYLPGGDIDYCHWGDFPGPKPKQSGLDLVSFAFLAVVERCTNLERLIVPRAIKELHFRPVFSYWTVGSLEVVLELTDVATLMREETAREWLKKLLKDLVAGPIYDVKGPEHSEPE